MVNFVTTIHRTSKIKREYILPRLKKHKGRTLSEHLGCCNFAIVWGLARFWDQNTLWHIMTTCVIMHNMIIENEQGQSEDFNYNYMGTPMSPEMNQDPIKKNLKYIERSKIVQHMNNFTDDLVKHGWQIHGH